MDGGGGGGVRAQSKRAGVSDNAGRALIRKKKGKRVGGNGRQQ